MTGPLAAASRSGTPRAARTSGWVARQLSLRVIGLALTLLVISVVIFVTTQALPGDVVTMILGVNSTPERAAALRTQLGLDDSLGAQYVAWFSGVVTGDFGNSLVTGRPVGEIIGLRVRNSLILGLTAFAIMVPVALGLGVAAAYFRDLAADRSFLAISMLINAMPEFVTGTLLIWLLSTNVTSLLPPSAQFPAEHLPWQYPEQIALPVLTLVAGGAMYLGRLVRASYIDVLSSEYIEMAHLKGVGPFRLLFRHALPNALAPTVPAAMLVAAFVIGGVVVVEYLYAYPGMGSMVIDAARNRDLPVLQALVMIIAACYATLNLAADALSKGVNRASRS